MMCKQEAGLWICGKYTDEMIVMIRLFIALAQNLGYDGDDHGTANHQSSQAQPHRHGNVLWNVCSMEWTGIKGKTRD